MPSKAIVRSKSKAIAVKRQAKNNPAKNSPVKNSPAGRKAALPKSGSALGALPEWNLADLYSGLDDPAIKRDLARIDSECLAFEEAFRASLPWLAQSPEDMRWRPCSAMRRSTI
jgi:oligoendopeptidase F